MPVVRPWPKSRVTGGLFAGSAVSFWRMGFMNGKKREGHGFLFCFGGKIEGLLPLPGFGNLGFHPPRVLLKKVPGKEGKGRGHDFY